MGKEVKWQSQVVEFVGWAHLHSVLWDIKSVIHKRVRIYIKRNVIQIS